MQKYTVVMKLSPTRFISIQSGMLSEPSTPIVIVPRGDREESIYEELCYITFRIKQVRKYQTLSSRISFFCARLTNFFVAV